MTVEIFTQEEKDFACAIHRLTCVWNHTDGCGWMYGEGGRYYIYEKAKEILPELKRKGITLAQIHTLADILKPGTRSQEWLT